jgi:GDP/UDP-N,N'-diacetylbacillosamine 2-epimerase (hydrolysing)
MRKVAALTGTRADYGIYRPVLQAISARNNLSLQLIVTGMHLAEEFGKTVHEIQADGFPVGAQVDMLLRNDTKAAMAKSLAICLYGVTQALESLSPDFLLVLGDRGEMLAGAIAAAHMRIATAHLHGGELSGSIDGSLRHAITKMAHLHFPVTDAAARCLRQSGEEAFRIIRIGVPGLDDADQGFEVTGAEIENQLGIPLRERFALVVFHPALEEAEQAPAQLNNILKVVLESELQCILFLPNSDAGRDRILRVIEQYESASALHCFTHISRRLYLGLLAKAAVMIGNSSSGIIEAPYFKLPVINIGSRQQGRIRAGNVIDIAGTEAEIRVALQNCLAGDWPNRCFKNPYRSGAGKTVADTLSGISIDDRLLNKSFTFGS